MELAVPDVDVAQDWQPLTEEQSSWYASQGYLHVRGLFTPAEVDLGLQIVDEVVEGQLNGDVPAVAPHPSYLDPDRAHTVRVRNAIARHRALAYFLDHPRLVGPLISLLGSSVQLLGTEAFYRGLESAPLEYWHTDGGKALQGIKVDPAGWDLQIKAQVFLTDVSEPGSGNFLLIPGSHVMKPQVSTPDCFIENLNSDLKEGKMPGNALTVSARPGDVLFFPYSIWHAVDRNVRTPRKTFIFRFGHLWQRPHDYVEQPEEILADLSPRLRRMFGHVSPQPHPADYYKPQDQDAVMGRGGNYTHLIGAPLLQRHGAEAFTPSALLATTGP